MATDPLAKAASPSAPDAGGSAPAGGASGPNAPEGDGKGNDGGDDKDDRFRLPGGEPLPEVLPLLSGKELIIFPGTIQPLSIDSEPDRQMIDRSLLQNRLIVVTPLEREMRSPADTGALHRVGTVCVVLKMLRLPDGDMRVLVQGLQRVRLADFPSTDPAVHARVEPLPDFVAENLELKALYDSLRKQFTRLNGIVQFPEEVQVAAYNITAPGQFCDLVVNNIDLSHNERLSLLDEPNVNERCKKLIMLLGRYLQIVELGNRIQEDVRKKIGDGHKEYYLREQLKAIQKELGDDDDAGATDELKKRLEDAKMPEEAYKETKRELSRMQRMQPGSAEYTVARTYVDWMLDLPWNVETPDNINLKKAREILDRDHYNLKKVKERIIEFLAVRKINPEGRSPILCLVGPPGVGKTSLGKSIAEAMGRKFVRHSLGGVRDEAEIRGHRRTYIGSLPGRIIQGLKRAGSRNPVFMLDEIDKLANDSYGDPASALLEALDPEQNNQFMDHYLDVPFDLSKVIFIATANQSDPIPEALYDRMEIINLPGYSLIEKHWIAKKHLLPRILADHGLKSTQVTVTDAALDAIMRGYTREAGLRNLEREIAAVVRKAAVRMVESKKARKITIKPADVKAMLGPQRFFSELAGRTNIPGVAVGLVWTAVGGDILFVESTRMAGSKNLQLTGSLGEVIKESAFAALSWIRANAPRLPIAPDFYEAHDYHIHFPEGAIPKDGPSAGIALIASLISLLVNQRLKPLLAMTGEITLRGKVLPVGGIKEKMIGAHLAGIKEVILPEKNMNDLIDLPQEVLGGIKFHPIKEIRDMLPMAFPGFADLKRHAPEKPQSEKAHAKTGHVALPPAPARRA
ncbi:MAG: endopeptidase La, partial [Planctomycetes bacterium]|nr:endopeptidase La [Planctomycetota bacterium]